MKSELQGLLDRVNKKTDVKFVDKEIYDTLQKKFGYNDFRPHQRKIINTIRLKKNILVKLPTGHGKSLCYQLPAIISEGITIVVSPLIALMKDQIDQLKLKGIKNAAFINSTLSSDEQHFVMKKVQTGQIKILYISPERFRSRLFISQLSHQLISIFVIDEAHCISQWGHDFRPDYLSLNSVINKLDPESLALFTATVPPEIEKDIVKQLNLDHFEKIAASSFRANLRYSVLKCADKEEKLKILTCYFSQSGGKGIIYVGRRSDAEFINHYLQYIGKKSDFYHAGRNKRERGQVQKSFFEEEGSSIDIVVATNAFGLGINKRNVRFVIHFAPPGSPEAYYQESGRAGRDGYPADCILLYSDDDWKLQKWFINNSIIKKTELDSLYSTLGTWAGYGQFRWIRISELSRVIKLKESKIKQCLSYLHRIQFLKQHPNISSTLQLNYWFNSPLEIADKINLPFIDEKIDTLIYCREYHISPLDLMEKLYDASWNKYISFYGQEDCLLIECIAPLSELNLITEDQIGINDYIQAKEKQLEKMMLYAFSKGCKQKYLCNYLDSRIPFAHNCGSCQICSPDSQIKITTTDYDDMVTNFINKRDDAAIRQHKDVSDIYAKASNYSPYTKTISSSNENESHILKQIVCLANSRKYSGWCFAGKVIKNGKLSEWIRPVSDREMGQLSTEDIKLQNGDIPKLLDVITVPLIKPSSHSFQPENYQIDSKCKWHRDTVYAECLIPSLCDPIDELWENKSRSAKGINDRIEFETAQNHINFSIALIQVNNLTIIVGYEIGKKKSIRAKFVFNNTMYCLAVTDPLIEHNYLFLDAGEYLLNGKFLLTISLGEPFKGYCYKLVAGIIGPITL